MDEPINRLADGKPIMEIADDVPSIDNDTRQIIVLPDKRIAVPKPNTPLMECPTNLDLTTQRGKALLIKSEGGRDYEHDGIEQVRIRVTHYLMKPTEVVDENTGEVREFVEVVLYDANGKMYRTSGVAAPRRLRALFEVFSPAEWADGIPLVITPRPSKRGAPWHDIQVDMAAL